MLAAEKHSTDLIARVCGDCPFVTPEEIDRVIADHVSHDVDYTTDVTNTYPAAVAADINSRDSLNTLLSDGEAHPVAPLTIYTRASPQCTVI